MNQKIIFLDIDGTLTPPGTTVPPASALEAIRRAQKKGHRVFLCTGRSRRLLSPLLQYGFDGFVGSAGGYIQCGSTLIYDCPLSPEQTTRAVSALESRGIYYALECAEANFTHRGFQDFIRARARARSKSNSEFERWEKGLAENGFFQSLEDYRGESVYKIVYMAESRENVDALRPILSDVFQFCDQNDANLAINGELINRKFNKGTAIEKVCRFYGIPIEDSIAFGDSMNDYEMLETAGIGICMENGSAALKSVADEICPSVENDGLFKAFERHGLI